MPPRRGGKSLVTRRTLVIASDTLAGQPALPLGLQSVQVDPERLADRGGQIAVARAAGRHVQAAQAVHAVGIRNESGEPPGPVVTDGPLRAGRIELGVAGQLGLAAGVPTVGSESGADGRATKSAVPSVSQRGASRAVSTRAAR